MEQNIMKNCRRYFDSISFENFMKAIKSVASSISPTELKKELEVVKVEFPAKAVDYFLNQWSIGGTAERWAEFNISRYPNFGISTASRVEGSQSALKGALSSSSRSLSTLGQKLNHRNRQRLEQLGVVNSNENIIVRYNIRTQVEDALLRNLSICVGIDPCRSNEESSRTGRAGHDGQLRLCH
ncbi:hypothetical protein LIPSTDRAFT_122571 [Lipomyces starkeyi NRRL Y-11557]|uniref:Uncharacterized protein n=1 Tax=Lipomyces starkeyi NRRL Y-11557 TaxID=675824 RepID=A0A1E3QEG8_LIPST|nr:hypothetical protein LIPSTDRAFT_122571 [Lipomyces starkeyi NRRL Y-11557]